MSNWYYYNESGEKVGPVSSTTLKELTRQGLVKRETKVENSNGRSALAGSINGLTFGETKQPEPLQPFESAGFDFPALVSEGNTPPGYDPFSSVAPVAQSTAPAPLPQGAMMTQQPLQFQVPTASLFCAACGNPVVATARTCPRCGSSIVRPTNAFQTESAPKKRLTYILLGLFIGTLGVHNFYIGRTGRGIAQLLITVCSAAMLALGVAVWNIVEVCTVKADVHGNPLI